MKVYYVIVGLAGIAAAIWSMFYGDPLWLTIPGGFCGGTLFGSQIAGRRREP